MTTALGFTAIVVALVGVVGFVDAHAWFVGQVWLVFGALAVAGALLAFPLARRTLRPVRMFFAQQDELVASALHELRGPLTRLQAVSESGLAGDEDPRRALHQVVGIAADASHTINDLASLAGLVVGQQRAELELLRLDLVVADALDGRPDAVPVRTDLAPASMKGHPGLLRRAVLNLVDNAVRHGRRGEAVPVVTVTVRPGELTVVDDGSGVAPARLRQLMEAANAGRHMEGLGMGLTLVGWVARLHGGEISAVNRPGGGLAVTIHLPPSDSAGLAGGVEPGRSAR